MYKIHPIHYQFIKLILQQLINNLINMAEKAVRTPKRGVMVYDTKKQKSYTIHPDMAKNASWMASNGLILEPQAKSFTNMPGAETKDLPDYSKGDVVTTPPTTTEAEIPVPVDPAANETKPKTSKK